MNFGKYIAHRGLHSKDIPENSLKAFEAAAEKNLSVELDVRLTKDCRIVVFHDDTLLRMCGVDEKVFDFTYDQLSAFSLGDSNEKIPLLSEVLKLIDGRVPLLIEIKGGAPFGELENRLNHLLKSYKGEYAVQSFDPFALLWFRIKSPETPRGQLISGYKKKFDVQYIVRKICTFPIVWRLLSRPDFVCADLRSMSLETAFQAVDADADLITWTGRGIELIETASQFSKTVIAEDFPEDFDFSDNWEE